MERVVVFPAPLPPSKPVTEPRALADAVQGANGVEDFGQIAYLNGRTPFGFEIFRTFRLSFPNGRIGYMH